MGASEEEEKFPFDINPMYEGERVRKSGLYVELGGQSKPGFELVLFEPEPEKIKDGEVSLIGPDLADMEEGGKYAYGMIYRVYGEQIEKDLEAVIVWVRISKDAVKKGLKSLKQIGRATIMLFKEELPFIERMEATFITDEAEVEKRLEETNEIYKARDEKTRGLHDEDVDEFYQCTLCQSFAPTNVCVVTPDRIALCGAMSWFDSRAAARVDPEGPNAPIPKGDCIDPIGGEYTGVNEAAVRLSSGEYDSIKIHSFLEKPHTSCGCFEVAGFYIPEVEGIGWVHRGSKVSETPIGLPFSTIAGSVGGGKQVQGFLGIGIQYFYSSKFIQYDGGWRRVVWMASDLKERVADAISDEMKDKIATEKDVKDIEELREFLKRVDHPVVKGVIREVDGEQITEGWAVKEEAAEVEAKAEAVPVAEAVPSTAQVPLASVPTMAPGAVAGGGTPIQIILKDADISIGKIIVKRKEGK